MKAKLITPPTEFAVPLDLARTAARLDDDQDDAELILAIGTYTDSAEFETQRALIEQTWRITMNQFPASISLPRPPLRAVQWVKFYDAGGQQQTLDPQDYLIDDESEPSCIVPAPGKAWPATADRVNAVQVQCTVGYGPDHTSVPAAIQGYILAKLQEHFAPPSTPKSPHLCRLLDPYRVFS